MTITETIKPADRLSTVQEYYFSIKLKEIAELNAAGKNIINLGIGSPDMPPSKQTINALCEDAEKPDAHGYQSYIGISELRESFAQFYQKWFGVTLNPKTEIQPLMGSKEGVMHISMAFLNPEDEVLIPNPGYPTYSSVSNLIQAKPIFYDLIEENNWKPDFEALEKLNLKNVKLMWVNYPNMPTGASADRELFQKLVDFGRKHHIVIVNDNPYSFILNKKPISILSIEGAKDICIELNSLSKSHNMPGWRMGMLATNNTFLQWVLKVKSNMDSGMFRPMQKAAVEALSNDEIWHHENNFVRYAKRRNLAECIMKKLGCTFNANQVGMFLWGKIPDSYPSCKELSDQILYNANVFITPGFIFGSNGNRYIRISLCSKEDVLQEALNRIQKIKTK